MQLLPRKKRKMTEYNGIYQGYIQRLMERMDQDLPRLFAEGSSVGEAARYSLLSGGKRVRGVLVLAVCKMLAGDMQAAESFGCAIEMLHCYSLIHDDLPCMDNAATRRGKPSCHKQYGETTALLAGDALLTAAFEEIAFSDAEKGQIADAVLCLSKAAGPTGMVYGQELDLAFEHKQPQRADLMRIHQHKTGDLINAAVALGAIAAKANSHQKALLKSYSDRIGLVFQIVDDILDVTATAEELGKPVGNDDLCGKITFATLQGIEKAQLEATQLTEEACALLIAEFGDAADFLVTLAQSLLVRKN